MNYDALFKKLTRLCAEMVASGGSSELVPMRMNYICNEYGLKESEFIVNSNGIMAAAIAPDGTNLTEIRSIYALGQNFGKLHRYDQYCAQILETHPSAEEIDREIDKINSAKYLNKGAEYLASIALGTGFSMLFGGDFRDAVVAVCACVLIVFLGSITKKFSTNQFFHNTVVCICVELLILTSSIYFGLCTHPESVSLGVIMLLISGLSFSDGLWALMNSETTIGIYKLNSALIGAIGIVIGLGTPLLLLDDVVIKGLSITAPLIVQVLECAIACGGFAVLCCAEKKHVPLVALGAGLSWLVYVLLGKITPSMFLCMAAATFAVTIYTLFISARFDIEPNILRTVGILPLVPGTNLFYMLYWLVAQNPGNAAIEATKLITACLGISFGFTFGRLFINTKNLKIKENASK